MAADAQPGPARASDRRGDDRPLPQRIATDGFASIPGVLPDAECQRLASEVASGSSASGGTRQLMDLDGCRSLARELGRHVELAPLLRPDLEAVQCTYFEKSATRNWLVPVHQDLSIPVARRIEHPDLQGWSTKEGSLFVQAPLALLQRMLALRVHLDDCTLADGPLRVVPGTHALGRLTPQEALAARGTRPAAVCVAERGSVLVMRPLLLHASSKSTGHGARRVLHFLFGPRDLPYGLEWPAEA